jgi:putative ABC transport system ATP-binding protein
MSASERKQRVTNALEIVDLADRMNHRPGKLSGGQCQRVGIARAIVTDPTIVVCDEPTGALDAKSADNALKLLDYLRAELGKTILMVTHDPHAAERAQRIVQLEKGQLVGETTRPKVTMRVG